MFNWNMFTTRIPKRHSVKNIFIVYKNGQCIINDISDVALRRERTLKLAISRGLCYPIIVSATYQPLDKSNRKSLFRLWGRVETERFYCHCNQAMWLYRLFNTWQFGSHEMCQFIWFQRVADLFLFVLFVLIHSP